MEGIGRRGDFPNGVKERVEDTRAIGSLNFGIKIEQNHQAKNTNQEKKILTLFPTSYLLKQGPKGEKKMTARAHLLMCFFALHTI